jgi:hypothetical protein
MRPASKFFILICASSLFGSLSALAWGGRGHDTLCEAAVHLVENENLRNFLKNRTHVMGHLCNVPDIYWYSIDAETRKQNSSTHYVDADMLGLATLEIPTDYSEIIKKYSGSKMPSTGKTLVSVPREFGSNWWRADQFFRRALEKNWELESFFTNLGLLGHFVGDNGQPFHSTIDFDGYEKGHGGIHAFYESDVVSSYGPELITKVIEKAQTLKKLSKNKKNKGTAFLRAGSVVEKMRALSDVGLPEIPEILKLDPITKPSSQKEERGMSLKTPAERKSPQSVAPKMEKWIVLQMARSAALLAQFWDLAYEKVGQPELIAMKNFNFPLTPAFVVPDYFDLKELDRK